MNWYKKCDKRNKKMIPMVVDTRLSIVDFVSTVNAIALEYFDANGTYTPEIGLLNTMRVFYNQCIKQSKFDDIGYNVVDALEMELIVSDEDFICAFNSALSSDRYTLDFANAYLEAMKIVENRKSSIGNVIETLKNALLNIIENINSSMEPDNIEKLMELAEQFKGNTDTNMIIDVLNKTSEKIN